MDGTKSKIGENSGLSYTWKQVGGPKVRIVGSNTPIASFEAPKVSLAKDKLTLKFVLSIADSLGHNNDKDTVTVVVKHDPSVSHIVDSPSSTNNNDNKDRTASQMLNAMDILTMIKSLTIVMGAQMMLTECPNRRRMKNHLHNQRMWPHPMKSHKQTLITVILLVVKHIQITMGRCDGCFLVAIKCEQSNSILITRWANYQSIL